MAGHRGQASGPHVGTSGGHPGIPKRGQVTRFVGLKRVPDDVGTIRDGLPPDSAAAPAVQGVQEEDNPLGSAPIAAAAP